jgi:hypothetical protein
MVCFAVGCGVRYALVGAMIVYLHTDCDIGTGRGPFSMHGLAVENRGSTYDTMTTRQLSCPNGVLLAYVASYWCCYQWDNEFTNHQTEATKALKV